MAVDSNVYEARIITHGLSISPQHEAEIQQAVGFATCAHRHQKRKYTGEPYINHCIAVARLVAASGAPVPCIIGAILHDTIEDTEVTFEDVLNQFGAHVAGLVMEVTSPNGEGLSRQGRHALTIAHLGKVSAAAATIKLADIIDNTSNIHERDAEFALTYLPEKWDVLDVLRHGNEELHKRALAQVAANLLAAKQAVYPLPLGPYSAEQFIMPPAEYEKDVFAVVRTGESGGIAVTWYDGAWQHSNIDLARVMSGVTLSSKQLAQAWIIAG